MDILMIIGYFMVCSTSLVTGQSDGAILSYSVMEESDPSILIGNIIEPSGLTSKYSPSVLSTLRYNFQSPSQQLFNIDERSGDLTTRVRINREDLCAKAESCPQTVEVKVSPARYHRIIIVSIEILDKNDNAPFFSESVTNISISESADPDDMFPLPMPDDLDSPQNGVKSFQIVPRTSLFEIHEQRTLDNEIFVQLVLKEELDREAQDFHQFYVIAYDGGQPQRSGSVQVNIAVQDVNDNDPVFTNSSYNVIVPENLSPNMTVVTVLAEDPDILHHGEITYSLTSKTMKLYGDLFGIKPNTGEIYLKLSLDAELTHIYQLTVRARDRGIGYAEATVVIQVQDINDNPPHITVITDGDQGEVSEVADIKTFVAHVTVKDLDRGLGGDVTCTINDTNFLILELPASEYRIVTNNMFDREEKDQYVVMISCQDRGSPRLSSTYNLTIIVKDVNDKSPEFNQTAYSAHIQENSIANAFVLRVYASDKDIGENARIRYSLADEHSGYFKIIPDTGIIRTVANLDYEEIQTVVFKVIATDKGVPANSATATVTVLVDDRNDEPPQFIQKNYSFGVTENQAAGTDVGRVYANDKDSEEFSVVRYAQDYYIADAFSIDESSGQILTKMQLDRESIDTYQFEVVAFNPGFDLTSTANVIVYVADANDHAPEFDFPNLVNDTVMISDLVPFGYVVTRIRAHDQDLGDNAQLLFALVQGNEDGLFDMDETTGALTAVADLTSIENMMYNLSIEIMDNGRKPMTAISVIHINVDSTVPFQLSESGLPPADEEPKSNSLIVIVVGCASGAIIVALVVAILAIRFQDKRKKQDRRYNCRMEAQKMLHLSPVSTNGRNTPELKSDPSNIPPSMYNPSTKYSIAGNDILNNSDQSGSDNNLKMGVTNTEGNSRTSSFNESGSLSKSFLLEKGRSRQSWASATPAEYGQKPHISTSDLTNQAPCPAHVQHQPIGMQQPTFHSFSLPKTEVGHHHGYHNHHDPYRHGDQQMATLTHGLPAHSAAINRQHLSPLAEDVQMHHLPWNGRSKPVDHDAESACSGEMSNTDSGRGGSEEGEGHGNNHGHTQPGSRLSDISDSSDIPDKAPHPKVTHGCHGNTSSSLETEHPPQNDQRENKRNKSRQRPTLKVLDAPSKNLTYQPDQGSPTSISSLIGHHGTPNVPNPNAYKDIIKNGSGYAGSIPLPSVPPREKLPLSGSVIKRQPPRPPRTDSLRKHDIPCLNQSLNQSFTTNTESQCGSVHDIADDGSSTTSGSYIIDHDDFNDEFEDNSTTINNVTLRASNV